MNRFAEIRKEFPITQNYTYLNNAAVAPAPPFVIDEAVNVLRGYGTEGGELESQWHKRIAEIRKSAARLIGAASGNEIFFTKNTSEGLNLAANSFAWKSGDNVICFDGEFPANAIPFVNLKRLGVEVRFVTPRSDNSFSLDDIREAADSRTRMLSLSCVQFSTGFRSDLGVVGEFCRSRRIFFVVDGVQAVGHVKIDVKRSGVDLLSAGAHKWLMSGEGVGLGYLRRESLDKLDNGSCGWLSLADPLDFLTGRADTPAYEKPLIDSAARFEPGTLNIAGIHALGKSIETMLELGMEEIEKRILALSGLAAEAINRCGYELISPQGVGRRSGINCFRSREKDIKEVLVGLRKEKVSVGFPCGAIRVSPHYYNDESDIERFEEVLKTV